MRDYVTPRSAQGDRTGWLAVVAVGAVLFGLFIGMPLTDGDTAFYARIAQNMLESGDWQTPTFKDYAIVDKPPMTFWLIALSYRLFGINEAAVRGWHVLMTLGTLVATYATVRLFFSQSTASLSAWLLLSSGLFVYCGIVPQQDMPLTLFSGVALYGFARFLMGGGWRHTYTFWVALALGMLVRGMQAVIFPGMVAALVLLVTADDGPWRRSLRSPIRVLFHLVFGVAIFAVIAAPWYVLEYREHGQIFFDTFFGSGNRRFFDEEGTNLLRWFAYIPLLVAACLPWSGLIGHALSNALRRAFGSEVGADPRTRVARRLGFRFFLVWCLVAFGVPFLIQWRVIRYLLPAMPPLATLVALYLTPHIERDSLRLNDRGLRTAGLLGLIVVVPILALTAVVMAGILPQEQLAYGRMVLPFLAGLGTTMLWFTVATVRGRHRLAVNGLVLGGIVSFALFLAALNTFLVEVIPWKEAAAVINTRAAETEHVIAAGGGDTWFLDFYVERWVDRAESAFADPDAFAGAWVVGTTAQMERFAEKAQAVLEGVWQRGDIRVTRFMPATQ